VIRTFLLPDPGEGLEEAEIVAWRVSEGDTIAINDVLVEIETSKSLVELPSPYAGTVTSLLVAEATMVEVGTPIVLIDDGEDGDGGDAPAEPASEKEPQEQLLVGHVTPEQGSRRRRRGQSEADRESVSGHIMASFAQTTPSRRADDVHAPSPLRAEPQGDPLPTPGVPPTASTLVLAGGSGPALAKPPVRKYAKDLGVDLDQVTGTGPNGTITRGDVEAAAAFARLGDAPEARVVNDQATFTGSPTSGSFSAAGSFRQSGGLGGSTGEPGQERRVPIKGVRKITAENMVASARTHVHVTEWTTIDVTATMNLVETLKQRREFTGLRISPLLVYAKAICLAMARTPEINASIDDEAHEIVYHPDVNLGIAAATPRGLMVPNIKGAQRLNLLQLCQAINELVQISREGKLQPADYAHGTFTITNVGVFGINAGTPIINGSESAILCMGSIDRRPWVVGQGGDERIEPRWVTTLALSFDHRLIDGEQGSTFLSDVASVLSDPSMALLF